MQLWVRIETDRQNQLQQVADNERMRDMREICILSYVTVAFTGSDGETCPVTVGE